MITIVIKDNTITKEDILAFIEEKHIKGEYEVITQEEYQKRKSSEPVYRVQPPPSYGMIDITGQILAEERRQRNYQKQQQKYARRFYKK